MAARSFLLLGFTQIAEHKLVNVLSYGCIKLICDFDGVVAAFSFNSFKLASRVHFAQEVKFLAFLVIFIFTHKQICFKIIARPCLQSLNLGRVHRAVALRDRDEFTR